MYSYTMLIGLLRGKSKMYWVRRLLIFTLLVVVASNLLKTSQLAKDLSGDVSTLTKLANRFSPVRNPQLALESGFIPIVIYVHSRADYFSQVIEQFRRVNGIEKTMIIISHDAVDDTMYTLSESIDFAQVRSLRMSIIVFPVLLFPPNFCSFGSDSQVKILTHTLPRVEEASPQRLKKHWLWLQAQVFDSIFPNYQGDVSVMTYMG